jgi:flagellar protein FlaG
MNISEVTNHAAAAFPPQRPVTANPAQTSAVVTERERPRETATASAPTVQVQQPQQPPSVQADDPTARDPTKPSELQAAVEKIQEFVSKAASDINFSIDEDSGRTVVKVIDRTTKDVIRQMPSQEMLDLAQAMDKLQGLLIKQKA